jgi:L-alanine-DL-glutamate epimerase-like enolase superfamily enzyme
MDTALLEHAWGKSAIDLACWDILGKATDLPAATLLGGSQIHSVPVYLSVPMEEPDSMVQYINEKRRQGITVFQIKVGEGAGPDIERLKAVCACKKPGDHFMADANKGWTVFDSLRVIAEIDDHTIMIENPCVTYEECLEVRRHYDGPMILDEAIDDSLDLVRAISDRALDVLVIKISHSGGLTKAREMLTLACRAGLMVRVEDYVGCELARAATAHLAVTVPPRFMLAAYPFPDQGLSLGSETSTLERGRLSPGHGPGLGVQMDPKILEDPIAVYE